MVSVLLSWMYWNLCTCDFDTISSQLWIRLAPGIRQINFLSVNLASYIHNKKTQIVVFKTYWVSSPDFVGGIFLVEGGTRVWKASHVNAARTQIPAWPFDTRLWPTSLGQPCCNPAVLPDQQSRPGQGCPKTGALPGKLTRREDRDVRGAGDGAASSGSGLCGAQRVDTLPWGKRGWADGQLASAHAGATRSSIPPPAFRRWYSLGLCRVCAGGSEGSPREQACLCLLFYIWLRQSLLIYVSMLSTPRVLGLPDAMSQREGMGVCGMYLWRKSSPHCGEERGWTRTNDSPYNILVEPGNAAVKTLLFSCTKEISIRISLLIAGPELALLTWCPGIPSTSPGMSHLPFCLLSAEL